MLPNTGEIKIGGYQNTGDYYPVIYSDGVAALTFGIGASPTATFIGALSGVAATFSGLITSNVTSAINATFNSTNASGGYISFSRSSSVKGYLGIAAQLLVGGVNDIELRSNANLFLTAVTDLKLYSRDVLALTLGASQAATFSGNLACSGASIQLNQTELIASTGASNRAYAFNLNNVAAGDFTISQGSTATGGTYTTRLTINPTGKVGIGQTSPNYSLTVNGSLQVGYILLGSTANANDSTIEFVTAPNSTSYFGGSGNINYYGVGNLTLCYGGGKVLIGSSTDGGQKLQVTGNMINTVGNNVLVHRVTGATTGYSYGYWTNSSGSLIYGIEGSTAAQLQTGSTAYDAVITTANATGLSIGVNQTQYLRIASTGAATFSSGISVGAATATTGGIQFPATAVAIASANNLDDYEEGDWTIGLTFGGASVGITTSFNTGKYTKIGRQVTVTGYLQLTNKGSSAGSAVITGLPFTIGNANGFYQAASFRNGSVSFADQFVGFGIIGDTKIQLNEMTNGGALTVIDDTNFSNDSSMLLSLTYFV